MTAVPLGVSLSNPGNIRPGDPWQGLAEVQPCEDFCAFKVPMWGFRAMARNLISYYDGARGATPARTIEAIIYRWAPPSDNNPTEAYIAAVCKTTGLRRDETLDLHQYDDTWRLCRAMTIQEQGSFEKYFTKDQLDDGLRLAGCEGCPPEKAKRSPGMMITYGAGAVASSAPVVIPMVVGAKETIVGLIGPTSYMPLILAAVFVVLIFVHIRTTKKP